jgi:hypothetical protein
LGIVWVMGCGPALVGVGGAMKLSRLNIVMSFVMPFVIVLLVTRGSCLRGNESANDP